MTDFDPSLLFFSCVLHDIGMTVALGAFLSLIFAAVLSAGRSREPGAADRRSMP